MKKTVLIILILGLFTIAKAQHCGWDGCYVIILEVRDNATNKIINDLDIILTDSNGKPYTSEWNLKNYRNYSIYQKTDTLKFGQNISNNDPKSNIYTIPFGINTYMLLVYGNNYPNILKSEDDKIIIQDRKGRYESKTIDSIKIVHMCTSNRIWRSKKILDESTIKIKINKKK
jgi:hypothetical protein